MKLSEYSDEDLIEEIKHRGFKIEIIEFFLGSQIANKRYIAGKIKIGGVIFDIEQ